MGEHHRQPTTPPSDYRADRASRAADPATAYAWAGIGGGEPPGPVTVVPAPGALPAKLPVRELARACVGACSLAAAQLLARRTGAPVPPVRIDEAAVAAAFVSERLLRIDGRSLTPFAPLSGFLRTGDGWVRTHANYPHHRAALLRALGLHDPGDGDDRALARNLAAELASRTAHEVQETVYAAGGLAVAVAGAPGPPPAETPPLTVRSAPGEGPARPLPPAALPAAGVRVLDLTRVIAGPVATRTLALLGADVLRIDPPRLPEDPDAHADTGPGKRSALLDLAAPGDRRIFDELLDTADVLVLGYRPGALDALGLDPGTLAARRPGLITARLDAWGDPNPLAGRRGFDSLVQAATGIAAVEAAEDGRPGVLPAQALDHGTGYLLAAAVLRALTERQETGGGRLLRLSLAATASWLLHGIRPPLPEPPRSPAPDPAPWLTTTASPYGTLRHALTPVHYEGAPRSWSRPPSRWGTDRPVWA
ncbi:CoA transferase [Streptomyces tsukubensis]|uniref:Carnitine dehydratase n=2 Tax=Streptomyces TaxID=1883 RepID=A0A7G3U954_STRT9|nr:CoA transferase [Streptomyces tsukubensis]AZK97536.1 carnitine dehydratase [Streptomyces tsukubensis]QKM66518.1 carnitine dehydratase [Streptomyces tsukubensis NRRL18488]TAI45141.1 carnitine dehydratase [Streptomyces tsukubensis]